MNKEHYWRSELGYYDINGELNQKYVTEIKNIENRVAFTIRFYPLQESEKDDIEKYLSDIDITFLALEEGAKGDGGPNYLPDSSWELIQAFSESFVILVKKELLGVFLLEFSKIYFQKILTKVKDRRKKSVKSEKYILVVEDNIIGNIQFKFTSNLKEKDRIEAASRIDQSIKDLRRKRSQTYKYPILIWDRKSKEWFIE